MLHIQHNGWDWCGMTAKMEMLGVWGRRRHWLWRWKHWHLLVKADRMWHALCITCMKLIVKYFFLADILFLGSVLDLDRYNFPWQTFWGGGRHLRLELSCIWVNMVWEGGISTSCFWKNKKKVQFYILKNASKL